MSETKEYYSCLLLEQDIDHEDLITIIEIARIALEQDSFSFNRIDIGHELDLSDEELERIYELIEIEEEEETNKGETGQELKQLRTMAKAYQVTDREMIRKLIREEYHRNGEAYEEHLSGRIEQQERNGKGK